MKRIKTTDDFQNLVKVDFQADADLGVLTLAELKAITSIIDTVEKEAHNLSIAEVNPQNDRAVMRIEIPRAVVDPYFESCRIVLERRWTPSTGFDPVDVPGDWTISERQVTSRQ